jgi:fibronectin-binding autotransporter adhesin
LTLTSTAVFHADISDANGIAGTSYDQVSTPGVTLGSSTLELNIASGLTFTPGQALVLISNTGASAISGTFAGLAQGGTVTADGYSFTVNYAGGDGNDFELDVVPEPSALAGLIFLSFLVLCHRGRKLRA